MLQKRVISTLELLISEGAGALGAALSDAVEGGHADAIRLIRSRMLTI